MIKRILFDLDNTLFPFLEEYWDSLTDALIEEHLQSDQKIQTQLKENVRQYENEYSMYTKEDMLAILDRNLPFRLPETFVDTWIKHLSRCYPKNTESTKDVLRYLSQKYELVVLTNWFTEQQSARLKGAELDIYFDEIIGTDQVLNKPNKEAFLKGCGKYKPEECIMIGDNLEGDILGALHAGLQGIYLNKTDKKTKYKEIESLEELKEIL